MKKSSKSPTKKEPKEQTSKRRRVQRPVQRKTKEVLAELVEKLRRRLELKGTPASLREPAQRPELRPNLDRLTVGVDLVNCALSPTRAPLAFAFAGNVGKKVPRGNNTLTWPQD